MGGQQPAEQVCAEDRVRRGSALWPGRPSVTSMGPSPSAALPSRLSARPPGESELTPPAGAMAQGWALLLLLLLPRQLGVVLAARTPGFGRSGSRSLSPEEHEFSEEEPVLVLSPEEPGRGPATIDCPRDCACSQEGVVDCGGIDLRVFPGDLPEHTNHLSLQVRLRRCANGRGRRRLPRTWWLPSRNPTPTPTTALALISHPPDAGREGRSDRRMAPAGAPWL